VPTKLPEYVVIGRMIGRTNGQLLNRNLITGYSETITSVKFTSFYLANGCHKILKHENASNPDSTKFSISHSTSYSTNEHKFGLDALELF